MLASSVCSSGACPDTSTVSEVLPTTSLMLVVAICPNNTSTVSLYVRKPDWLMLTLYDPGFNKGKLYKPVELVTVVWVSPVVLLFRLTCAPGTIAPDGSVTVPEMAPVTIFCDSDKLARINVATHNAATNLSSDLSLKLIASSSKLNLTRATIGTNCH